MLLVSGSSFASSSISRPPADESLQPYRHSGFRWEAIQHLKAPNGAKASSLRLSQKIRAIAYRDGEFLRLISLHPDHDSAYES